MLTYEESISCHQNDFPGGFSDFSQKCEARWRQVLGKWSSSADGGSSSLSASLLQQESEAARRLSAGGEASVATFIDEIMHDWMLPHRELIQA